jgi:hypothetical protein
MANTETKQRALKVTEEQIDDAIILLKQKFSGNPKALEPDVIIATVQAIAINYQNLLTK